MSYEFADKKTRYIFLINNFDLVNAVLNDHTASSLDQEKAYFEGLLNQKMNEYVEQELQSYIGNLMTFVPTAEHTKDIQHVSAGNTFGL